MRSKDRLKGLKSSDSALSSYIHALSMCDKAVVRQ